MAVNNQISPAVYGGYRGAVKAKDLHLQKQRGDARVGLEEKSNLGPPVRDGFDRASKPVGGNGGPHSKARETGNGYGRDRNFDKYDFAQGPPIRQDTGRFSYGNLKGVPIDAHGEFKGSTHVYQFTQITVTYSDVFNGANFDSPEKSNEAYQSFLDAARSFIQSPGEQAYKSLNDAMIKLMNPNFVPAVNGGAAQVSIRNVNGATMAKFTMEVTPAPAKTLEEAREALKDAYASQRDGEKDIASVRAEAYTDYIRALSEKFKQDGVISHTNNTPTTPVFKSSVIYVAKVTQVNVSCLHEIKKPEFGRNLRGRLTFKNQHGFWNDYRNNHESYVDMLRRGTGKTYSGKDFEAGRDAASKHSHHRIRGDVAAKSWHDHNTVKKDKAS